MAVFLTDRYHGMFTGWHNFLPNRPIAAHIARIHARIIWTLQSTFVPIAFIKLPGAVCAGRNSAQIKEITRVTVPDNRLLLTQEFVSYSELKWFLLNYWWRMKHLKHKNSYSLNENKNSNLIFTLTDAVTVDVSLKYCWGPVAVPHHDPPVNGRPSSLNCNSKDFHEKNIRISLTLDMKSSRRRKN